MKMLESPMQLQDNVLHIRYYECFVHQQLNFSYRMSTFQFRLDRMERIVDQFLKEKIPGGIARDMNDNPSEGTY